MVPSTINLVVKDVAEDVNMAASLAILVVRQAVAVHLVVVILASLDSLGSSLDTLVATMVAMDNLGSNSMVAVLVAMDNLVVVVLVPGGVAGEVAPLRDRSSVSGVARLVTSPPSVKMLW